MHVAIYNIHDKERARARRLPVTTPTLLVGSDPTCDIRIEDDPKVAPRHATIAVRATSSDLVAAISIRPLAGSTRVNGTKIADETTTKLGDTLQLGDTVLKFRPDTAIASRPDLVPPPERPTPVPPPQDPSPWARPGATPAAAPRPANPWAPPVVTTGPVPHVLPTEPMPPPRAGNPPPPMLLPPPGNPPFPRPISPPVPPVPYRANARLQILSNEPMEQQFLATLRDHPSDEATRLVYADWLEQRGHDTRAEFVRTRAHVDSPRFVHESDLDWRAITSRTPIEHCGQSKCPARWDCLEASSDDDRARTCKQCAKRVYFCHDHVILHTLGIRKDPVAFDASLDRISAHQFYTGSLGEPVATLEDGIRVMDPGDPVDTLRDIEE